MMQEKEVKRKCTKPFNFGSTQQKNKPHSFTSQWVAIASSSTISSKVKGNLRTNRKGAYPSYLCKVTLTELKKEWTWLKEVDSTSLQNALKHLDDAFQRFFKKQNDRPRFKSKKNPVQSYTSQCNYPKAGRPTIEVKGNKIRGYFKKKNYAS
jgi:transposase